MIQPQITMLQRGKPDRILHCGTTCGKAIVRTRLVPVPFVYDPKVVFD